MSNKVYLGDGLYATFDGYGVEVTSENGIEILNTVYFEPEVLQALNDYFKRMTTAPEPEKEP